MHVRDTYEVDPGEGTVFTVYLQSGRQPRASAATCVLIGLDV